MPPEHLAKVGGEGLEGGAGWHASFPLGCSPQTSTFRRMINGECLPGILGGKGVGQESEEDRTVCEDRISSSVVCLCLARLYSNGSGEDPNAAHVDGETVSKDFHLTRYLCMLCIKDITAGLTCFVG